MPVRPYLLPHVKTTAGPWPTCKGSAESGVPVAHYLQGVMIILVEEGGGEPESA